MLDIKERGDIYMKEFEACPFSTSDRPPSVCKACNLWLTFDRVKPENTILSGLAIWKSTDLNLAIVLMSSAWQERQEWVAGVDKRCWRFLIFQSCYKAKKKGQFFVILQYPSTSEPGFLFRLGYPFTVKSRALSYNPKAGTSDLFYIFWFSAKWHEITHSIDYGLSPISKLQIHF